MYCGRCGTEASASEKNCAACGAPLDSEEPAQEPEDSRNTVTVSREAGWGRADIPTQVAMDVPPVAAVAARGDVLPGSPVRLGDGEVLWKQYRAVQLRGHSGGQGTLYVTDSRVVFYAQARGRGTQRESSLVQQTKLEDITGLAAYVSHRLSLGWLIASVVSGLIALVAIIAHQPLWIIVWLVIFALCLAALLGSGARRGSAGVIIHARATMASPIGFGHFGTQHSTSIWRLLWLPFLLLFRAYNAFDVTLGAPGEDSSKVIAELGALIMDLQTRGTLAGEHWGVDAGNAQRSRALS